MSRVGKNAVTVPSGVEVAIVGRMLNVKGKQGQRSLEIAPELSATLEGGRVHLKPREDSKRARTVWGTYRNLVNNLIKGLATPYTIALEINGVGFRAAVQGKTLNLQLGFSHDINFPIPDGIAIKCDKPTLISVTGVDRQLVGQVAANIRAFRAPEPYKGKGIKYDNETILRKEGKKK